MDSNNTFKIPLHFFVLFLAINLDRATAVVVATARLRNALETQAHFRFNTSQFITIATVVVVSRVATKYEESQCQCSHMNNNDAAHHQDHPQNPYIVASSFVVTWCREAKRFSGSRITGMHPLSLAQQQSSFQCERKHKTNKLAQTSATCFANEANICCFCLYMVIGCKNSARSRSIWMILNSFFIRDHGMH